MRELNNKDLAALDKLSTGELQSILESDAALELDSEVLLYMLSILENRNSLLEPPVAEEEALKSLKNNYLTDEIIDIPIIDRDTTKVISLKDVKRKRKYVSFGSRALKPLITAALVIVLMFTLSFGAMAAGIDVFGAIARWTEDLFGFARYDEDASVDAALTGDKVAPVLEPLYKDLVGAGVTEDVLPAFIPEGFIVEEYSCYSFSTEEIFACTLDNEKTKIYLSYTVYNSEMDEDDKYHKEAGDPEEYIINGITHYIIDNNGEIKIIWMNSNVECSISGRVSEETLTEIVESIYGVNT